MSENLGSVYYTVDADTTGLLAGSRGVESATRTMNKSFEQTDKIASKLTATFSAVTAALSTNKILAYGEAWVNVNNKLSNSVKEHEKLADVTQRVFDISQNTRASIASTADLYQKLESSTREAGKSGSELAQIAETINKALVVSGATAQGAESVILQLGQALSAGAIQSEEFNAIADNGQRIVKAIAKEMGVATGALKKLASEGKITSAVVINALTNSAKEIATEFDKMQVTMSQSFTIATNNLTKFIGESAAVNTVMGAVGSAAVTMSTNLDEVANVATVLAVVMGSKLAGSFVQSAAAKLSDAKASQANAVANSEAAAAVLRRAVAEKESTVALLAKSRADVIATKGTSAHAFALEMQKQRFTAATNAIASYNAAMAASAAASRAASVAATIASTAMNGLKTAVAFLGGPVGVVLLAAYAIYEFGIKANETRDKTKVLDGSIAELTESYKKLGEAQAKLEQFRVSEQLDSIYPLLSALEKQKTTLEGSIAAQEELAKKYKDINPKTYDNLNASIATQKTSLLEVNSELETQYSNLDRIEKKQELINKVVADGAVSTNKPKTVVTLTGDQIKNIESINSALADQRAELTKTADGYEEYSLRKQLAANGASEAVIQASLLELKAQQELRKELEIMEQADADTQTQKLKVQTDYEQTSQQITADLETPAQKAERELSERLEVIRLYNGLETQEQAAQTAIGLEAHKAYSKQMAEIDKDIADKKQQTNMQTLGHVGDFFGNMAEIAKAGGKKQFAIYKIAASAQAGISAAMAIMSVLADQTVPFWLKPAAVGTMAALAGVQIAQINSQSYGGGKLYGGSVQSGTMYPVNENGAPELFQSGNKQYLMPNSRGEVISNKDATGSGGGGSMVTVNVINQSSNTSVTEKRSMSSDRGEIIDIIVSDINARGKTHRAITNNTTAGNKL